jgi:hypothetical protein
VQGISLQQQMKFIYTIFLLLITAAYILPVKEFIKDTPGISITDMADEKEESKNKEKLKEFISVPAIAVFLPAKVCSRYQHNMLNLPTLFHTIETPPPDNKG